MPGSLAQWLLGLFIVLALIASLLMVFGNDISLTASLAVIAALWAAVIGAVLVTKYRRQADVAENRSRDLRLVYELQLEREIAARRQYESEVETAIRHELAEETNEEFEELKAQVLALRASLEKVLGNPLPEVPLALRPERRRELGAGLTGRGPADVTDDRVAADLDFASTAPPADPGRHAPEPVEQPAAVPSDVEMTEIIPVVTDDEPGEYAAQPDYSQSEYSQPEYSQSEYSQPLYDQGGYQQADYTAAQPHADYTASRYEYTSSEYTAVEYAEEIPEQGYDGTGGYQAYDAAAYQPPVPPVPEVPAMPQRGRRAAAADEPGAHTAGQPASELLDRLRQSRGDDTGGRRRRD